MAFCNTTLNSHTPLSSLPVGSKRPIHPLSIKPPAISRQTKVFSLLRSMKTTTRLMYSLCSYQLSSLWGWESQKSSKEEIIIKPRQLDDQPNTLPSDLTRPYPRICFFFKYNVCPGARTRSPPPLHMLF